MITSELEAMSIKQLEQLRAGCFPGSVRYDQVTPILEGTIVAPTRGAHG